MPAKMEDKAKKEKTPWKSSGARDELENGWHEDEMKLEWSGTVWVGYSGFSRR